MKHYTQITAPTAEPVAVNDAVGFMRSSGSADEQALISMFIAAARGAVEDFTGRALMLSSWRVVSDRWATAYNLTPSRCYPSVITLERSPLVAVANVKYYAYGATTLTTLTVDTDYIVITGTTPGRVQLLIDAPVLADRADAVQVEFTAGASTAEAVPATLRQAVQLLAAHFYELRTPVNVGNIVNEIPLGIRHILESQRVGGWIG